MKMKKMMKMKQMMVVSCLCGLTATVGAVESARFLKAGEIMPKGWMKEQIHRDLAEGYFPKYDQVNHTVTHELFVNQNRVSSEKYHDLRCWWSGEHEGYWKDGVLRMAFLSGDEVQKKRAVRWLDDILAAQGLDGYIGMYQAGNEPNTRFQHVGENGELWVQSRIFQALIAGYEFTGNEDYLTAVKRAVDLTIQNDPGNYFDPENKASGGVSHAVGFFDTLWYLYSHTGERRYADYAVKLYADFSEAPVRDDDLQVKKLLSEDRFERHGAHIAEGFYIPAFIASLTEDAAFDRAAERAMEKLNYHLTPSGAMVCDENVKGQPGSGRAGYEYCGIAELVQALTKITAINGSPDAAEMAESMTLNAGQGSRFPVLTALSYITHDNRKDALPDESKQHRPAYAAFHNAAACCTLNGGRLLPYYIEGMWTREKKSLTAQLYGPHTVDTQIDGVALHIEADTHYPFEDSIRIAVDPAKPLNTTLRFRIPKDAADVKVTGVAGAETKEGYVLIDRTWKKGDAFTLTFDFPIKKRREVADSKEVYLKRGPLVYALPIEHDKKVSDKKSGLNRESGFNLYEITAKDLTGWDYLMPEELGFAPVREGGDKLHPFAEPPIKLRGSMLTASGEPVETTLLPIGCTVLRRTTFPVGAVE